MTKTTSDTLSSIEAWADKAIAFLPEARQAIVESFEKDYIVDEYRLSRLVVAQEESRVGHEIKSMLSYEGFDDDEQRLSEVKKYTIRYVINGSGGTPSDTARLNAWIAVLNIVTNGGF